MRYIYTAAALDALLGEEPVIIECKPLDARRPMVGILSGVKDNGDFDLVIPENEYGKSEEHTLNINDCRYIAEISGEEAGY